MASELLPAQQAQYSAIIDDILRTEDLNTVSAKRIRKGLQDKIDHDITPQKKAITELIMQRFDKFNQNAANAAAPPTPAPEPAPTTNGTANHAPAKVEPEDEPDIPSEVFSPPKRKATSASPTSDDDDLSDVMDTPPPKKAKKVKSTHETDEEIAKRMQAELNAQSSRSTRGGGTKRKPVVSKAKKATPKKKSKAKINSDDDSDVNSSSEKPEREKKGGFHKEMALSPPLAALVGSNSLSRPQTVKHIWAHIKEHNLQDPSDRRNIFCDEPMRAVFERDKVHMFTMNKLLKRHLYAQDE